MWDKGTCVRKSKYRDTNKELKKIKGFIEAEKARILIYKFFRANTAYAIEVLFGVKLFPFQVLLIKSILEADYLVGVLSRGASKTYCSALAAMTYAIMNPGVKIGIVAKSFRQSRQIFSKMEDILAKPAAALGLECRTDMSKGADQWVMKFGTSEIFALPLGDGCLSAGLQITYKDGIKTIGSLFPDDLDFNKNDQIFKGAGNILSDGGFKENDEIYYRGIADTLKITTKKGYGYEATPNHKVKILTKNGLEWSRTDALKLGDYILIDKSESEFGKHTCSLDEAYALGAMIGDGCYVNKYRVSFATKDDEMISYMQPAFLKEFKQCESDPVHWNINSMDERKAWLGFWGMEAAYTKDKKLPPKILGASKSELASCISGLFDTDGHVQVATAKGGIGITVGFTNTSEVLCKQIQNILLRFGIISFLKTRDRISEGRSKNVVWEILITGEDAVKFHERIGFRLKRKIKTLSDAIKAKSKNVSINDTVPFTKDILIDFSKTVKFNAAQRKNLRPYHLYRKKNITRSYLNRWIEDFPELKERLGDLANPNYYFDEVKTIENGRCPTYDLHVPENHQFVGNGFHLHNSKLRGFRFNLMIIDEFLLMPESIYNEVILPFLAVVANPQERREMRELENKMIAEGKMTEAERHVWLNNKMVALSSASYKFDYLYKLYQKFERLILDGIDIDPETGEEKPADDAQRVIIHMGIDAVPADLYDTNLIKQGRATMSQAQFDREFNSIFLDDSAGYFKVSTMKACTIEPGMGQGVEVRGFPGEKYIVAIDPSWSESDTSDDFAIQVLKMGEGGKATLVHSFALSGHSLNTYMTYFLYIMQYFNPVLLICDYMGGVVFINACNESQMFKDANISIGTIDIDFNDHEEYTKDLERMKREYNSVSRKICIMRTPAPKWIRQANELLQSNFDHRKIMFASGYSDEDYTFSQKADIPIDKLTFKKVRDFEKNDTGVAKMIDFIDHVPNMIQLTKDQCALIIPTSNTQGTQHFDLPPNLKRITGPDKPRKDLYSALILASWGAKIWDDMNADKIGQNQGTFTPFFVN